MLGHRRSEMRYREEDLDEYEEEEGYGQEEEQYGGEEEEEEEEEEEHKPTPEELEYLRMREVLKEKLRLKVQKENAALLGRSGGSGDRRRPPANAEFGSFFGPSKPVIARRVIEERHSLQEIQHIKAKESTSNHLGRANMNGEKRPHAVPNGQSKSHAQSNRLNAVKEIRSKAQALKDMRDYSFLLADDTDDIPASSRDRPPRKPASPHSAQAPPVGKSEMNKHAILASEDRGLKKSTSNFSQKIPTKVAPQKAPSRSIPKASVPKKKSNGNVGNVPSRFPNGKISNGNVGNVPSRLPNGKISNGNVGNVPFRLPNGKTVPSSSYQNLSIKKPSATSTHRPSVNPVVDRKTSAVKPGSSTQKPNLERRKEIQGLSKGKTVAKQPVSSSRPQQQILSTKPKTQQVVSMSKVKQPIQASKPQPQLSKPKPSKLLIQQRPQQNPLKRKPVSRYSDDEDEGEAAISMIRKMFGYNPSKYAGVDEDDSDMEANFDDIMMEEHRSGLIAQREDEEQLRLIEEEEEREERERLRRLQKKKQKLG